MGRAPSTLPRWGGASQAPGPGSPNPLTYLATRALLDKAISIIHNINRLGPSGRPYLLQPAGPGITVHRTGLGRVGGYKRSHLTEYLPDGRTI